MWTFAAGLSAARIDVEIQQTRSVPTLFLSFEEKNKMMNWRVQMEKIVSVALLESYIFSEIPAPGVAVNEIWGFPLVGGYHASAACSSVGNPALFYHKFLKKSDENFPVKPKLSRDWCGCYNEEDRRTWRPWICSPLHCVSLWDSFSGSHSMASGIGRAVPWCLVQASRCWARW